MSDTVQTLEIRGGRVDIEVVRGNAVSLSVEVNQGGSNYDLSGCTTALQVVTPLSRESVLLLTGPSGGLTHDTVNGIVTGVITSANTAGFTLPYYQWALQITPANGQKRDIAEGYITLINKTVL